MSKVSEFQRALRKSKVYLHFDDGKTFEGFVNRDPNDEQLKQGIWAEAAFTTGMSGYQETITDPSFLGQHIIFSNAHIGNYESDDRQNQSHKSHASSIIARNFSPNKFFETLSIPLISAIDTRSLVRYMVAKKGTHKSVITTQKNCPSASEFEQQKLSCGDLARVSQQGPIVHVEGDNPICLINYGVKNSIIENLKALNIPLVSLPYNASYEEISSYSPRMIFLSNGPGDPRDYNDQIQVVSKLLRDDTPIRGICLGHQLICLGLNAEIIKLPFGQRGVNHPCFDHVSSNILITSQNHGYAVDELSFNKISKTNISNREFYIQYKSLFDLSIEGIASTDHKVKSVQFHPESNPGPSDAHIFFQEIENYLNSDKHNTFDVSNLYPMIDVQNVERKDIPYKKILLIGSGPIKIGQASEFDYSGTQACKALKELGLDVVLLNSNPATIMTDPEMAYRTYIEPITKDTIKKIIQKENVDAVLSTMGGQTALNICIELEQESYLKENGVKLLGANVDTINKTEDRALFAIELNKLGYQTGKRFVAHSQEEAITLATSEVEFPLIIRRDFALGGKGAALIHHIDDLHEVFTTDLKFPITMEKSLLGWKEVELEVMVDKDKNGVIICSIENVDPCGIHTGDSITVAPAQTISDRCYQQLRTMSLTIAKHMGVVAGGANVQFAINPQNEDDIVVIEMNPRVSRSSALASKATGYPIAKISALLAVGYTLREILNDITKASPVAFEPSLDYVAVKIPIFPFSKFPSSSQLLGPQMRSVGEVLALGSSFNEAFLKALRSLELGLEIPELSQLNTVPVTIDESYIRTRLSQPFQLSLLSCLDALRLNLSSEEIAEISKITPWFIEQIEQVSEAEKALKTDSTILHTRESLLFMKQLGLSDKYIAYLTNLGQKDILELRFKYELFPVYKAVDTCSGEFQAQTPYFYSTYNVENEAHSLSKESKSVVILGSGPNRIGQGIEFDYSCVKSCQQLKLEGIKSIMINSNPETVSTDYDSSDRLYLSALYSEDLFDILLNEDPYGVITSFSGQTGINIRSYIENSFRSEFKKINFLGSSLDTLDLTEDRKRFSEITKKVNLSHTKSKEVQGYKKLVNALTEIGLPVIIRPSYVIGGESMYIFHHHTDIEELPEALLNQLKTSSTIFQVETYLENATEYDVDLIRDSEGNCIFTVCEHIEYAGVHSGDSGMISPPVRLNDKMKEKMFSISKNLADELAIIGPINFQYAVKGELIYCIEANPRGSRTLPFLSKATNISLPKLATQAMLGKTITPYKQVNTNYFTVKQSTFPFDRFVQDNIILGPKMRSTGETLGIDKDKDHAMLKSYLGNYPNIDTPGKILLSLADHSKQAVLPYIKHLRKKGYSFCATRGTYNYIKNQGLECELVSKIDEQSGKSLLEVIKEDDIVLVFNTPMDKGSSKSDGEYIRNSAIQYAIPCFTREENIISVMESIIGSERESLLPVSLQEIHQ
ncbi:carbamoyl-phosphate synthase large subunit [Halobacteriovorax sp. HLS]|uniref:carbamoyl-phosphate synthase large subunit n=1 Tax=Halobacteriovorax sp. HLS TaxID=2234000 RepID=UPI000FD717F9|nr:carbamoyl-phosphate synthase large subunit [Halobacteriovorax sp. HLS]